MRLRPYNLIDAYKYGHPRQYPEGTSIVFSNLTPRKSRVQGVDSITFFGLQYFLKEYLQHQWRQEFFEEPLDKVLSDWQRRYTSILGQVPFKEDIDRIAQLWEYDNLPLEIRALPEGSQVPMRIPPLVVWNTEPWAYWLTNNIETVMSATLWQPCTSATLAREFYKEFHRGALKTVGNTDFIQWQGHDFSFRGMSSVESAVLSAAAHLLYFTGTDTVPALDFLEDYYFVNSDAILIGGSVPATEHSVMCMGGKETEIDTFRRLLGLYPTGILSVVSDTWDFWKVITETLPQLKEEIMARDGKLVIRPDSGDPADIICGVTSNRFPDLTPGTDIWGKKWSDSEIKGAIECLWDIFGGKVNELGYKELDPHIGLIYGDSINIARARDINGRLEAKGFATTNWVAGIGSYTYQYNTRDTFGWAMKATYGEIGEETREIYKDPKTDDGTKKSAKGLIAAYEEPGGTFSMKDQATWDEVKNCAYVPVFRNGALINPQSLLEIREIAKSFIYEKATV